MSLGNLADGPLTRFLAAPAIAALSQALGLLQYVLLWLSSGFGYYSDSLFLMQAWVLVAGQIVLQGVAFPAWLRSRGQSSVGRELTVFAVLAATCLVTAVGWWRICTIPSGYDRAPVIGIVVVLLVSAPLATIGFAIALRAAARGSPILLAAFTLPTSVLACLVLPWFLNDESKKSLGLAICMLCGNVCFVAVAAWVEKVKALSGHSRLGMSRLFNSDSAWFAARSGAGYSAGVLLQTVGSVLPASALSILSFSSKFVAGVVAVGVNSVLPRLVHRDRDDTSGAFTLVRCVVVVCVVAVSGFCVVSSTFLSVESLNVAFIPIVVGWAAAASINAAVQRVALKSLPASASKLTILACVIVTAAAILLAVGGFMTVLVLASLFMILEISSALMLLISMRQWRDIAVVGCGVVICGSLGWAAVLWQ